MIAWHFVGNTLRDGRPVPADGEWLQHDGPLVLCKSGLHASLQPFNALQYAPGPILCLVEVGGDIRPDKDKLVCSRRRIIARMDATEMLRYFARMQALSVVHLWAAPDVVLDYLMLGDESLRATARATARAAARAAARDAAWDAAWDAAMDAAMDAARAAAMNVAWDAAVVAEMDAAWDAARATARADFNDLVYECFEGPLSSC